jgi:hypothetical protein
VGHMVGCSGAQINLSVQPRSGYRPTSAWSETSRSCSPRLGNLGKRVVAEAKSGRKAYEVVTVLHPKEPCSTGRRSNRVVSRHTKRAPQRIGPPQ